MKKMLASLLIACSLLASPNFAWAENTATHGEITGKSVVHGLASLIIWPGLGQYLQDNPTNKNVTHALLGLTGIFRLWSGWDSLIQRKGGRWDGKI